MRPQGAPTARGRRRRPPELLTCQGEAPGRHPGSANPGCSASPLSCCAHQWRGRDQGPVWRIRRPALIHGKRPQRIQKGARSPRPLCPASSPAPRSKLSNQHGPLRLVPLVARKAWLRSPTPGPGCRAGRRASPTLPATAKRTPPLHELNRVGMPCVAPPASRQYAGAPPGPTFSRPRALQRTLPSDDPCCKAPSTVTAARPNARVAGLAPAAAAGKATAMPLRAFAMRPVSAAAREPSR
mmetsp:Transcript_9484/g.29393  ORF Transcript_9484/g.29393 Transcript_9484/m.29393 type:complete len:240 (+) Transcript_9484:873-1592(+)